MSTYKLRNGGKVVRVSENELDKYLTKGYIIVEDKPKVTEKQETVSQEPISDMVDTQKPRSSRRKSSNKK